MEPSQRCTHSGPEMKITKAQAQANREHVVETASKLFRERGYDGVGVADLMAAAGFTHGGFYKQFRSKADLMAESAECGIAQTVALSAGADAPEFVRYYLSREHRDARATGCTMAALGGDAARQPEAVRATFAAGIESLLAVLSARAVRRTVWTRARREPDPSTYWRTRSVPLSCRAPAPTIRRWPTKSLRFAATRFWRQ